jgi:hypothetical protein
MATRSDELKTFKRLNLVLYAESRGFTVDRKASSKTSIVVRNESGDKLIISRDPSGTYFYFNAKGNDSGTIIDLVQHLDGGTIGDVRRTLRGFSGSTNTQLQNNIILQDKGKPTDRQAVVSKWNAATHLSGRNEYLTGYRAIPESVYLSNKFAGCLKIDGRQNLLAGHHDREGICGFEIKNGNKESTTFTGFSPGGKKGLFSSNKSTEDQILVLTESFIDALSVAAITGVQSRKFMSISGNPSPFQMELLRFAISRLASGYSVEMRFDHDEAGAKLAERLSDEIFSTANNVSRFEYVRPPDLGTDWNDYLKQQAPVCR